MRVEAQPAGGIRRRIQLRRQQQQQQTGDEPVSLSIRNLQNEDAGRDTRFRSSSVALCGRFVANRMPRTDEDNVENFQDDTSDILASRDVTTKLVQYRLEAFDVSCQDH